MGWGLVLCFLFERKKKKKKNSIVVFGWQNIISQWHYPQHIHVPGVPHH
jgi:hypothetical protein